jgi:hypothetical protein
MVNAACGLVQTADLQPPEFSAKSQNPRRTARLAGFLLGSVKLCFS